MHKVTHYIAAAAITISGCGGDGTSTILNDSIGNACDNNFHQTIIGRYTGIVTYPSQPGAAQSIGSCEWSVDMRISVASDDAGCFLNARITAPVTQNTVLSANDPLIYQCFGDDSLRDVIDGVNIALSNDEVNAIPFPHPIEVAGKTGVPVSGPYFGDATVRAGYVHLFDSPVRQVQSLMVDGNDTLEIIGESVSGVLDKETVQ